MTKNEARDLAFKARCIASGMTYNGSKSEAVAKHLLYEWAMHLETAEQPKSIAERIRDAAINWHQFLGDLECSVLDAFCHPREDFDFLDNLRYGNRKEKNQSRTFMLLVAEALE